MARPLFATALAQTLALAVATFLLFRRYPEISLWTPPEWRGVGGNAFFIMLFIASALLLRKAGSRETSPRVG